MRSLLEAEWKGGRKWRSDCILGKALAELLWLPNPEAWCLSGLAKKLEELQPPSLTSEDPISPPSTELGSCLTLSFPERAVKGNEKQNDSLASPTFFPQQPAPCPTP